MDNYIVSARKYRPATFDTVVGQRALTTTLKNAIANNKLAHAYLFCGPRGVGKICHRNQTARLATNANHVRHSTNSVHTISMSWMPPLTTLWKISAR